VYEFPVEMFLAGADLTPITENIDKIIAALTEWEPERKETGVITPAKVTAEGKDYQEAVHNMDMLFLREMWGDGLPIIPATEEWVDWILTGTDLPRDEVIGQVNPRAGLASVEAIAVALAMAGGRPEYLPVLIAAVKAITTPKWGLERMQATTASIFPAVIVNGPAAQEMRLSASYGCLGPDPLRPAGGPIGRALRLILQDMGGAVPGIGTMAIYGGMRYTNAVFAEDEEGLPSGWKSLAEDRGFARGSNVVTVTPAGSVNNERLVKSDTPEKYALENLYLMATFMGTPHNNMYAGTWDADPDFPSGVVMMGRGFAEAVAGEGWSKEEVKTFLWENSKVAWSELVRTGLTTVAMKCAGTSEGEPVPLTVNPEQLVVVVTGGIQSGHNYWMQVGSGQYRQQSAEIELPANWDELLKQAEEDLGPPPAAGE